MVNLGQGLDTAAQSMYDWYPGATLAGEEESPCFLAFWAVIRKKTSAATAKNQTNHPMTDLITVSPPSVSALRKDKNQSLPR